ncbi:hypothetical protein CesoFtcFv8_018464 [Champsocephalus esox]|uniref:Uncharacterized protein n=2 Tax=Champsocephalus TaxID=52236 RepID=A0AAN8D1Z1_CHAGU|nr:hypothetical protein CesoFtcFv8_018464 [Champsocephalus esox]KAK5913739.1 hypothetical protein CgunFtcFv8_008240 [Champsocephalus gunnari]
MSPVGTDKDKRAVEDCGYVPGLGRITVSLTTVINARTSAPPSTPQSPPHLNSHCAELFCSDFHLPPRLFPLSVLSPPPPPTAPPNAHPHPRPIHGPDSQTGREWENHTHPHVAPLVSSA